MRFIKSKYHDDVIYFLPYYYGDTIIYFKDYYNFNNYVTGM